ncbi:DNA-directed RNA polymerase I, subunit RPA34.5 [Penicillium expansum]|uniref:DNA-directed RNA polymerase I, subunit RPA34.5 n=1 Tax=Penicillium expansum TaxID=27334 RepID=A0A0A2KV07_PENEN|nr:DNA-directed RNA polymerase I, subunit RPA34.5 [Penicillium expansum]KAJ5499661.1 DNA-directed RNA polymerase I subunit RPA34.5 [Penicillium expansum]KGO42156.1 DNA-directed RNA polymerase I, subunit RPA34.5 [Penicillium expansum]KGO56198.1 DNA-directed RNA polymerase I, subunit RPA34.5 [Penicillium expansum]KGO71629.1 DNA-directed RNA polymerase I, subunit RPA34.5 [Penicillium expansum]
MASSDSDSSSSRSTSPELTTEKEKKMTKHLKAQESSEDETSDSGSDSDSDSDDSNEMKPSSSSGKKVVVSGPQPYKPPAGFKSAKKQAPPSSKASSLLSNLNGKQVLHLTAPASLPLSKVKEVCMAKIMQGEPIISHDGVNYGIPVEALSEADPATKSLLLFDEKTQTYCTAAHGVPSYHVQEMIDLPSTSKNTDAVVAEMRKYVKPARLQPKNLKMRFRPVGTTIPPPETLGCSSESEAEVPSFKVPKGEERKRKLDHDEAEDEAPQAAALPRKKSKKHSQEKEEDDSLSRKKSKKSHKEKEEKKRKKSEKA